MDLHPDFKDLLEAFAVAQVRYLLVGGYAVGFYHRPRFTKDIDLWIAPTRSNLARVRSALTAFGAPPNVVEAIDQMKPDDIVWMGSPPVRVDILQRIPGLAFEEAYARRVDTTWNEVPVAVIGRADLIIAKRAAGRPQDLLDAEALSRCENDG